MLVHLEFEPKNTSYQFLYEIALYDTNPSDLDEIYETICSCELKSSDCSEWECTPFDTDCSAFGVKIALATNPNTSSKTILSLAKDQNELLRAIISVRTENEDAMNILAYDSHIYVVKNLLENNNLTKTCFDIIFKNFINCNYDFSASYNKAKHISKHQFARFLLKHRYATEVQIKTIKEYMINISAK